MKISIFWFRRDLRLEDNTALNRAFEEGLPVLPLFIFDTVILDELATDDPRISFIYSTLEKINNELHKQGSSRWGEAYFAGKLLDYELASNNGNWQWAAGTGCDAAQYFRVFNPNTQQIRFDRDKEYIKRWIPEIGNPDYPEPMIDHNFARKRVIEAYKSSF